jgi:hypothetical protein
MQMSSNTFITFVIVLGSCFCGYELAWGGDCPSDTEYYLECLEGKNPEYGLEEKCPEPVQCFWCVGYLKQGLDRWASDREARRIREFRDSPYHDRILAIAEKYLDDPEGSDAARRAAAGALAFQGVRIAGGHDVFSILVGDPPRPVGLYDWYVLAALGDPRTVELARDEYVRLKQVDPVTDSVAQAKLLNIVDCLYHIPEKSAEDLLRELGRTETNAELREELNRAVWKRSNRK